MEQLTEEQAVAMAQNDIWKDWTDEQIVGFQLFQNCLCGDWDRFRAAIEAVLKRPVYTHEFAGRAGQKALQEEYLGLRPAPTLEEIIDMIPAEKRIIIKV